MARSSLYILVYKDPLHPPIFWYLCHLFWPQCNRFVTTTDSHAPQPSTKLRKFNQLPSRPSVSAQKPHKKNATCFQTAFHVWVILKWTKRSKKTASTFERRSIKNFRWNLHSHPLTWTLILWSGPLTWPSYMAFALIDIANLKQVH